MSEASLISFEKHGPLVLGRIEAASVLDAMNVSHFGAELTAYVEANAGVRLLLDFENVDYLSSAVLTELLRINKKIAETHGSFRLCSLNRDIRKVFEITNLDKMFVIYDSAGEGLKKFARAIEIEAQEDAWEQMNRDT